MSSLSYVLLLIFLTHGQTCNQQSKAAKKNIGTREVARLRGVAEDLAGEITAISSAIAVFMETTPVLRTVSKLVSFVLHGIAKVAYAIFQVWYNMQTSEYNPIFLVERQLYRILVAVIEYILNYELIRIPQDEI